MTRLSWAKKRPSEEGLFNLMIDQNLLEVHRVADKALNT